MRHWESRYKSWLKTQYNLSIDDVVVLYELQKGLCIICGKKLVLVNAKVHNRAQVDHDHKTGKVRGLLCFNCNGGLGNFKDDVKSLLRAAYYLKFHS